MVAAITILVSYIDISPLLSLIEEIADSAKESLSKGNAIILAGNGGSFADYIHLAAEFVSRFAFDRTPLPALAREGNVFIGISTRGDSKNIVRVV